MAHYVITGGAGFIGSNLIRTLYAEIGGLKVTCIDNFDPFYPRAIKELNLRDFKDRQDFSLIEMDLAATRTDELAGLVPDEVDAIIHIAAKAGVRPSILNPLAYQQANVIGLQNMLDFAKMKNVEQFVFASSSSVYGINDHFPWSEDEQLMPVSPYAATKLAGEMMGHVHSRLTGMRFIALRFFTVYGPGQRPDLAIHRFVKSILSGKPIAMYGDGSTSRDYTFVNDTVRGIIGALNYDRSQFEIFNIGNNYSITLKELISSVEMAVGRKVVIEQLPEQAGDVPKTFADISKARDLLGYSPSTTLNEGLVSFVDWFRANIEVVGGR